MAKDNERKKLPDVAPGVEKDLGVHEDHPADDLRPDQRLAENQGKQTPARGDGRRG
jgi:hypothetical protein